MQWIEDDVIRKRWRQQNGICRMEHRSKRFNGEEKMREQSSDGQTLTWSSVKQKTALLRSRHSKIKEQKATQQQLQQQEFSLPTEHTV
jgi:hypothetical protein